MSIHDLSHLATIPAPAGVSVPSSGQVLGIPVAVTDYERTLDWIDDVVAAGERGYVCVSTCTP